MPTAADPYSNQNHYEVLGLDRDASPENVKSAYRLRTHIFHPDKYENYPEPLRGQLKAEAAKEFKKLTAAYGVLSDAGKRAAHDRQLGAAAGGTGRAAAGRSRRATSRTEGTPAAAAARARRAPEPAPEPQRTRERDPLLVVRPDRLDFGTLAAGTSKQLPLKISNAGGRTLFGEITANRAWISVNRRSFVSSSTLIFVSVDTAGLHAGEEYAGTLAVTTLNGGDQVVPVVLRVSGRPEPLLAGVPPLLDFGLAEPGSSKARTVKFTNAGSGTLIGSIAVKGSWLAVTENRFRGNTVSLEVIANTAGLGPGEQQGELLVFSNGGQAALQVVVEIASPAPGRDPGPGPGPGSPGGAIVGRMRAEEPGARDGHEEPAETPAVSRVAGNAAGSNGAGVAGPGGGPGGMDTSGVCRPLLAEAQRSLLRRVMLIEPETVWERDFLRAIAQMIRSGEPLAPGELAKVYELEARASSAQG